MLVPRYTIRPEDAMPRMRAYLARAGVSSLVRDLDPKIAALAREIYSSAFDAASPEAFVAHVGPNDFPCEPPRELDGKASYTLALFTLGRAFDDGIARLMDAGETTRGVFFDAWGSEAVEALAEYVDAELRADRGEGTIRFAPGYGGYDITNNAAWLEAIRASCGGDEPDCSVDPRTGIITPRKSIICAIGWLDHNGTQGRMQV